MAKDELNLVKFYIEHKGWELVDEAQKEADTMIGKWLIASTSQTPCLLSL